MKKIICFLMLLYIFVSCTQNKNLLGEYNKEHVLIPTKTVSTSLDSTEYDIIDVIPLNLPPTIKNFKKSQIKWINGRIYILDSEFNQALFVFDDKGNFIYKLGGKGHAKNEFIEKPTCFSIDKKTGDIHIYERQSVKVLIFSSDGTFKESINLRPLVPGSIELLDNCNYLMCFESVSNGDGHKLAIYKKNKELVKSLMDFTDDERLRLIDEPIFDDNDIVYNPLLSDSRIVISGDTVKNVIKIDFDCEFNSEETMRQSLLKGKYEPIYKLKDGVQFISNVEMTDSLIHISYVYNMYECHFLKNRINNKVYNSLRYGFINGIMPTSIFTIKDNELVYLITEDMINLVCSDNDPNFWESIRKKTPSVMLDIIDKKIKTPVIVTYKLKLKICYSFLCFLLWEHAQICRTK